MHWIYAHLIGDYLIQNDWMAYGKKEKSWICAVHVITYMLPFVFCDLSWLQLSLIAVEHFIQDRTDIIRWYMSVTGKSDFSKPPMSPWSMIVTDNIVHILFMALIVEYL